MMKKLLIFSLSGIMIFGNIVGIFINMSHVYADQRPLDSNTIMDETNDEHPDNESTNKKSADSHAGDKPGSDESGDEPDDDHLENEPDSDETATDTDDINSSSTQEKPRIYIKAVNPGYKINGKNNVGEMIELSRTDGSDTPISLAGIAVGYTNSSGKQTILVEFPENSWMTGENLLLRLASSPGSELANLTYSKTLAMNASINLSADGEIIDEACWTGKDDCAKVFTSANPTTLVRNLETGDFEHRLIYFPEYQPDNYYLVVDTSEDTPNPAAPAPKCRELQISELLSYYESAKTEQFIEFHNIGSTSINIDGCKIRYKNKKYLLSGDIESDGYHAYYPVGFSLTKNPTSSNKLEIIDTDDTVVDTMEYPNGQRKGTAYAWLGHDGGGQEIWKTTYTPTPGAPNHYQEYKTCEAGKIINEATGNCVKISSVTEKACGEGYFLNIFTGRCKKLATTTPKTCKEGYYLNPETNRCRKIKENNGADYHLEPETYNEESSFVALYAVAGVLGVGLLFLIWEFRHSIIKTWKKVFQRQK